MAQPARQKQITVGDVRITYLPDGHGRIDKIAMFPATTQDGWKLHPEWLDESGRVVASIGGFLIQTGGRNVLVDTGYGDHEVEFPGFGPFVGGVYCRTWRRLVLGRATLTRLSIPICISTTSGGPVGS